MLTLPLDTRAASIAARNPAMPEPTITRSYDLISVKSSLSLSSNDLPFAALHEYKGKTGVFVLNSEKALLLLLNPWCEHD